MISNIIENSLLAYFLHFLMWKGFLNNFMVTTIIFSKPLYKTLKCIQNADDADDKCSISINAFILKMLFMILFAYIILISNTNDYTLLLFHSIVLCVSSDSSYLSFFFQDKSMMIIGKFLYYSNGVLSFFHNYCSIATTFIIDLGNNYRRHREDNTNDEPIDLTSQVISRFPTYIPFQLED